MASKIEERLSRLGNRRAGLDRIGLLNESARTEILAKSLVGQKWQKRALNKPFTRYALGAMQPVDDQYTRVSVQTAERVGNQLRTSLTPIITEPEFRLQGSVPLNIHIRGVSDVDLLVLRGDYLTFDPFGSRGTGGFYTSPTTRTSVEVLRELRALSEGALKDKYPAAKVDTSGGKAIKISGGSLARPVDVVPSHWHDSVTYQSSGFEFVRPVVIFDKKQSTTIENLPFLHINEIQRRCDSVFGGLRKAIRLCKNLKADLGEEGIKLDLPSFDLAALLFHADIAGLAKGQIYELAILAEVQRFLDVIYHQADFAFSLRTPDGTRTIFDSQAKYDAAKRLSVHMDDLLSEVAAENDLVYASQSQRTMARGRAIASSTYIPSAP